MKKLGLAMSGGGAKAFCYLGFLRELEAAGLAPTHVSAHSGAALLLCYLESGLSDEQIITEWSRFRYWRFVSSNPFANRGFLSPTKLIRYMHRYTAGKDIAQSRYDTVIYTSDLSDLNWPKRIANTTGDLATVAVISSLVPPLFPLYRENGQMLGDGGFTSAYSALHLRQRGAEVVVGLFPNGLRFTRLPFERLLGDEARVAKSLMSLLRQYELAAQPVDVEVDFDDVQIGLNDFARARDMFGAGKKKAHAIMPQLARLL